MTNLIVFSLIFVAAVLGAVVRVYKSIKSGLFYNLNRMRDKNSKVEMHPALRKYHQNIHFLSSPANYYQQGMFFLMTLAVFILMAPFHWIMIPAAASVAWGQSTMASYWWQIWINRGSGLPDIDPNENHMSEFAWGKISFWFSSGKLFNGKRSILLPFVGAIQVLIGFAAMIFFVL